MFQNPVTDISIWTITPAVITVPESSALRYPGYALKAAQLVSGSAQPVLVPVKSFMKIRNDGANTFVELEPLLISNQDLAKKFAAGFPNIYIRLPETTTTLTDGIVDAGFSLGSFSSFSFAIQFSDRIERDISLGADIILAAMQDIVDTSSWQQFCTALRQQATILLLNANGKSFEQTIRLRIVAQSGGSDEFDYVPGTTNLAQRTSEFRPCSLSLANPGPDPNTNCLWVNTDALGQAQVSYGSTLVTDETRVILFANLFEWFAPQSRTDQPHPLPMFSKGNKVTTFVNGPAYYNDLFTELNKAAMPEGKFFLAGYAIFQDDQLVTLDENIPKSLLEATKKIVDAQGQCYYLPLQLIQLKHEGQATSPSDVVRIAAILSLILADIGIILFISSKDNGNKYSTPIISIAVLGGTITVLIFAKEIIQSDFILDQIKKSSSVEGLDYVNGNGKSRKIWAIHPATWDDNSYGGDGAGTFALDLAKDLLPGISAYHQKIAVVRNPEWTAYCGGIDLNPNRMDDARHLAISPYHDVHAKINGPAVRDLAITFIDRWNDESADEPISLNEDDLPSIEPLTDAIHIVQVARTNFQVNPVNGSERAFTYAPTGDRTILDTLLQAIRSAKEYIYIEDQYFTPTPEYKAALLEALDNGLKSLVIVMPSAPDQPYGETERAPFIDELLQKNDPENPRVRVGFARRSYLLPSTTSEVLTGRMMLGEDISDSALLIKLGPVARQLAFPFWLSVDGEIMLVTGTAPEGTEISPIEGEEPKTDNTYKTYNYFNVERGIPTNFFNVGVGCLPRKHRAGTPATAVAFNAIYIHAKCMMVDDMFVSIGSANMNRRGFHSDAEANIFLIPEPLRFTPANPVAALRKELWSELLNIPATMGAALLEDPVSSSKLFDRDSNTGNRFIPYRAVSTMVKSFMNKIGDISIGTHSFDGLQTIKDALSALALTVEGFDYESVFFYITDPSSFSESPHEP